LRLAERLPLVPQPAGQGGNAKEQQRRTDDRAGDLRLHDLSLRLRQHEQRQHQFGCVAKAHIQQAADRGAGVHGDLRVGRICSSRAPNADHRG